MPSILLTYHGDARLQTNPNPFRLSGLPPLPLEEEVEITAEYARRELSQHDLLAWATALFDPETGSYNTGLPVPRITFRLQEEPIVADPPTLTGAAEPPPAEEAS